MMLFHNFICNDATKGSGLTIGNTYGKHFFFALVAELPLRFLKTPTRYLLGEREEALLKTVNDVKAVAGNDGDQLLRIVHQLQAFHNMTATVSSLHGSLPRIT